MLISTENLEAMAKLPRVQLATSLPGPKPICLVGTRSTTGVSNLAPFSSVTHLGSNPILLGMVTRPDTVDRHTLKNILMMREWSLNHVTSEILEKAHQCSARYPSEISEFKATGLTETHHPNFEAPFVTESPLHIGLTLEEIIDIPSNNTKLIVGRVKFINLPTHTLDEDGSLDLPKLGTVASTALDTYFSIHKIARLPYAKANPASS
jgi:flavin reductase (DIM6/NTAB) family NADH-FMN oxidoreductase RutF